MTWIVMGFCIGIGLMLFWIVLYTVAMNWQAILQAILWITAGLIVLAVLMAMDDDTRHTLFRTIAVMGLIWWMWGMGVKYGPRWRWVQNLNAAYQKRTGGKV